MIEGKTDYRGVYMRPSETTPTSRSEQRFDVMNRQALFIIPTSDHIRLLWRRFLTYRPRFSRSSPRACLHPFTVASWIFRNISWKSIGSRFCCEEHFPYPPYTLTRLREAICVAADAKSVEVRGKYGVREMRDFDNVALSNRVNSRVICRAQSSVSGLPRLVPHYDLTPAHRTT